MREIKFRSWNGDTLSEPFAPWELVDTGCDGLMTKSGVSVFWGGYPQNWMQFTGRTDKNGHEIYEGDVVKGSRHVANRDGRIIGEERFIGAVAYDDWWGAFRRIGVKQYQGLSAEFRHAHEMEIIGNVWENPELLGAK